MWEPTSPSSIPVWYPVWYRGHRVASYLTNLQTTKSHHLKVPKITLITYRRTNKEHFPVWLQFHSSRGTKVAELEGLWLPRRTNQGTSLNNWTKRRTKTQIRGPQPCAHSLFSQAANIHEKDISDIIKWCHCHLLLHFQCEKPSCMCSRVMPTHLHVC